MPRSQEQGEEEDAYVSSPSKRQRVDWTLFADPLADFQARIDYSHSTNPRVTDIEDVRIDFEDFSTATPENTHPVLRRLCFRAPKTMGDCRSLCSGLLELRDAAIHIGQRLPSGAEQAELQRLRTELFSALSAQDNELVYSKHSFVVGNAEHALRLDIQLFLGLLRCYRCLALSKRGELSTVTSEAAFLAEVKTERLINPRLYGRPFAALNMGELVYAIATLENRWCYSRPAKGYLQYIDLLLIRLADFALQPQPRALYPRNLGDYYSTDESGLCSATPKLLEDFCWAVMPMRAKYELYTVLSQVPGTALAAVVEKSTVTRVEHIVRSNCRQYQNTGIGMAFTKAYFKLALRPGEYRRYRRDFPQQPQSGSAIVQYERSVAEKNQLMEALSEAPWIVAESKAEYAARQREAEARGQTVSLRLQRSERDILLLLLINAYVNNCVSAMFNWLKLFVHLNAELLGQPEAEEQLLSSAYPLIVQSYNAFAVYHRGTHYSHRRVAAAFVHWLRIVLGPEFRGNVENYDLKPLAKLLLTE